MENTKNDRAIVQMFADKDGMKRTSMRRISIFSLLLCMAIPLKAQTTATPISNLNQPSSGYANVGGGTPIGGTLQAVSFTTGNTPSFLSSISVSLGPSTEVGIFRLYLASDTGGSPGAD